MELRSCWSSFKVNRTDTLHEFPQLALRLVMPLDDWELCAVSARDHREMGPGVLLARQGIRALSLTGLR